MLELDILELISECQDVEAEDCGHNPFAYRTCDMESPASIAINVIFIYIQLRRQSNEHSPRIPMSRIAAIEQDVRNYSADGDYHKENGTEHTKDKAEGRFLDVDEGLKSECYDRLIPKV